MQLAFLHKKSVGDSAPKICVVICAYVCPNSFTTKDTSTTTRDTRQECQTTFSLLEGSYARSPYQTITRQEAFAQSPLVGESHLASVWTGIAYYGKVRANHAHTPLGGRGLVRCSVMALGGAWQHRSALIGYRSKCDV